MLAKAGANNRKVGGRCHESHAGRVASCAKAWMDLPGVDLKFVKMLEEGLYDPPQNPVFGLPDMKPVPQSVEDLKFGNQDLEAGCRKGVYRRVSKE